MLKAGPAQKVTIVVGEASRHGHEAVYVAVLNYLFYHDVADAFVTKAEAGFGGDHQMQSARFLETSLNVPIKIEFVEESAKVPALMPKLLELVADGFVSVQDITIVKGLEAGAPLPVRSAVLSGTAKLVRIFVGESDTWRGKKLHDAIVESLRANDLAGATVYRGIAGYGAHRRFHKESRMSLSSDLPIMISVIDEEAKIRAYLPVLEQMIQEGLVVLSDVDVIRYTHRLAAGAGEGQS
jgi:PII-like signaling protein